MSAKSKISVGVITYNQQDSIRQTLDSIFMQQGDFDLELVIGEDCSTDNTYAICQEYASKSPITNCNSQIVLLQNKNNLGIMANYARVMHACSGEFISIIAGDDYYIDNHALEKQMFYMQAHPEVGVMGANGYQYFVRRNEKIAGFNPTILAGEDKAKKFYFSSNYRGGVYLWPIGLMIRQKMLQYLNFEEMIRRGIPVEDYPMQAILSQYTQFACLPDLLVDYRVYKESASFLSYEHPRYLLYHRGLIETRRYLNKLFPKDACFSEKTLQEQLFYKEFLYHVYWRDYGAARELIKQYQPSIADTGKWKKAHRITLSRVFFYGFSWYKRYKHRKENKV